MMVENGGFLMFSGGIEKITLVKTGLITTLWLQKKGLSNLIFDRM